MIKFSWKRPEVPADNSRLLKEIERIKQENDILFTKNQELHAEVSLFKVENINLVEKVSILKAKLILLEPKPEPHKNEEPKKKIWVKGHKIGKENILPEHKRTVSAYHRKSKVNDKH